MARSKAYLFGGVEIRWKCDPSRIQDQTPAEATFRFPNGLADFLGERIKDLETVTPEPFAGRWARPGETGKVEWAVAWTPAGFGEADSFMQSYCNTVPTPEGGTHEAGFRAVLTRGLKQYAELTGEKRGGLITADDVVAQAGALVSVFVANPEFQGQTKERLSSSDAQKLVEKALADPFDHWLTAQPKAASALLEFVVERAEERLKRRRDKEVARASATRKLRLPGKLADCAGSATDGTELFLVEGDSAGGSAKQARDRKTQAILPLRGKILNVASASTDKFGGNKELADLLLALGVQAGSEVQGRGPALRPHHHHDRRRRGRRPHRQPADHLLLPDHAGPDPRRRLYLALPPLYRLSHGGKASTPATTPTATSCWPRVQGQEARDQPLQGPGRDDAGAAEGNHHGSEDPDPGRVTLPRAEEPVESLVEALMGRKPELRFRFIQENAEFAPRDLDV
jgi:topoisomerase-4 subunit B